MLEMSGQMEKADRLSQLFAAVEILEALIRNIALKQALHRVDKDPHLNFWRLIYGNQMDVPVLEWCKLFGADDAERQPVHWKNVASDLEHFRAGLFASIGIDADGWSAYWQEMKKYRDMEVAHHDSHRNSISKYPLLNTALHSAFYYFDYVRSELRNFGIDQQPSDIREYARKFEEKCVEVATVAMSATRSITENVI